MLYPWLAQWSPSFKTGYPRCVAACVRACMRAWLDACVPVDSGRVTGLLVDAMCAWLPARNHAHAVKQRDRCSFSVVRCMAGSVRQMRRPMGQRGRRAVMMVKSARCVSLPSYTDQGAPVRLLTQRRHAYTCHPWSCIFLPHALGAATSCDPFPFPPPSSPPVVCACPQAQVATRPSARGK